MGRVELATNMALIEAADKTIADLVIKGALPH